jgi:peptidylprolyl isomerase
MAGCGSSPSATPTTTATPATTAKPPASSTTTGTIASEIRLTTTTVPQANPNHIALIPVKDRSPAGHAGKAPTVVVPSGKPPTQLEMADLIVGKGAAAETGDPVNVQYVLATYSSRKVVQSSWTDGDGAFPFTVGTGVITGWSEGVVGMRVGGRRELIIPPSLAYQGSAEGPGIAANDTLVFVIDLLSVS